MTLTQRLQFVSGTLGSEPMVNGRLRGEELSFSIGTTTYRGRVSGGYRMRVSATIDGKRVE